MRDLFFALALLAMPAVAWADAAKDPIDVAYEACLASPAGQTSKGQLTCNDEAYFAYADEMDKALAAVLAKLDKEPGEQLAKAQEHWLVFREAEFAYHIARWPDDADKARLLTAIARLDILRARVQSLRFYAED
jgi:uncharacterized protein YecT (DUF1311 family)